MGFQKVREYNDDCCVLHRHVALEAILPKLVRATLARSGMWRALKSQNSFSLGVVFLICLVLFDGKLVGKVLSCRELNYSVSLASGTIDYAVHWYDFTNPTR